MDAAEYTELLAREEERIIAGAIVIRDSGRRPESSWIRPSFDTEISNLAGASGGFSMLEDHQGMEAVAVGPRIAKTSAAGLNAEKIRSRAESISRILADRSLPQITLWMGDRTRGFAPSKIRIVPTGAAGLARHAAEVCAVRYHQRDMPPVSGKFVGCILRGTSWPRHRSRVQLAAPK